MGDHNDELNEIEVIEFEDDNGTKEEFAILEEVDFEGRHLLVLAPLEQVQAISESGADGAELDVQIFEETSDGLYKEIEDTDLADRLMQTLSADVDE